MRTVGRIAYAVFLSGWSLLPLYGTGVHAQERPTRPAEASALMSPQLIEQGSYVNRQGQTIHRPAHTDTGQAPTGASAQCRDGTFSFSASRRGTCSHHGGVATWL
ncbi:DUF3761 domain-containing protein [Luteibacter sahnii]|uniref:DUF3761 domain-containing protein n=1 Tax=Luteibacter sahnii TaxID=3021977 RepID=UPI0031B8A49F